MGFKVLLLVFKAFNGLEPAYSLTRYFPQCSLRSSAAGLLEAENWAHKKMFFFFFLVIIIIFFVCIVFDFVLVL